VITPVKEVKKEMREHREPNSANSGGGGNSSSNGMDKKTKDQLHTITQLLKNPPPVQFNKKLLDFDYGSDEEEGGENHDPVNPATLDAIRSAPHTPPGDTLLPLFRICDIFRRILIPGSVHWITDPSFLKYSFISYCRYI
jgi:hypothetical protein